MCHLSFTEWNPWSDWEVLSERFARGGDRETEGGKQTTASQLLKTSMEPLLPLRWSGILTGIRGRIVAQVSTSAFTLQTTAHSLLFHLSYWHTILYLFQIIKRFCKIYMPYNQIARKRTHFVFSPWCVFCISWLVYRKKWHLLALRM